MTVKDEKIIPKRNKYKMAKTAGKSHFIYDI